MPCIKKTKRRKKLKKKKKGKRKSVVVVYPYWIVFLSLFFFFLFPFPFFFFFCFHIQSIWKFLGQILSNIAAEAMLDPLTHFSSCEWIWTSTANQAAAVKFLTHFTTAGTLLIVLNCTFIFLVLLHQNYD